jgi:single-strand DNA-binding protein
MINHVYLLGNLADEPATGKGKTTARTTFTVIHNGQTEGQKAVMSVTTFGKVATFATGLTKGSRVLIIGRLDTRRWNTEDGQPRSQTGIVASLVLPVPIERQE